MVNEFSIPGSPFFGPQEGLASIVPAGQVVEEWVYHLDGEIRYVWFWGEGSQERDDWRVVLTGIYPEDAVY